MMLNENELKLFQFIKNVNLSPDIKNDLIDNLMRQVKNFYQFTSHKKTQKWVQVGDRTLLENIDPVTTEENAPLASSIIQEQRKRIIEE
ncbi:hypothetical protein [Candidatus Marithrix sp. Canyon 246]|uniref:hypothetical protein n=1 Tax=Candidatus Marithrix sp. Canyon 246 TaxID=1827136 RepID=UPI00114CB678|nr:hypothetical protein [Candidatus Marithrix sp. Canyon 246]